MFKITITQIGTVMHKERDYVGADSEIANDGAYHVYEVEQEAETPVYSQRVEFLDLTSVIDAVNKKSEK